MFSYKKRKNRDMLPLTCEDIASRHDCGPWFYRSNFPNNETTYLTGGTWFQQPGKINMVGHLDIHVF